MNDYLVQYATTGSRVYEWTKADNHINAATNVLIDKGFDPTFENDLVLVVHKNTWKAGVYSLSEVRQYADRRVGLSNVPDVRTDFPDDPADSWKG